MSGAGDNGEGEGEQGEEEGDANNNDAGDNEGEGGVLRKLGNLFAKRASKSKAAAELESLEGGESGRRSTVKTEAKSELRTLAPSLSLS